MLPTKRIHKEKLFLFTFSKFSILPMTFSTTCIKPKICCYFINLAVNYLTFTALHSVDKFTNVQRILGSTCITRTACSCRAVDIFTSSRSFTTLERIENNFDYTWHFEIPLKECNLQVVKGMTFPYLIFRFNSSSSYYRCSSEFRKEFLTLRKLLEKPEERLRYACERREWPNLMIFVTWFGRFF